MDDLPDLATLSLPEIAALVEQQRLPPVDRWTPAHCGDSEMRIARDGTWFHQGSPIGRPAMVRLFSTILRREADGGYVLVTPVEKLDIVVDDLPFLAVEVKAEGAGEAAMLAFRLNTGEFVTADAAHPIAFEEGIDGPLPSILVRGGLSARIVRSVFYELADRALDDGAQPAGVWSGGAFFALTPAI